MDELLKFRIWVDPTQGLANLENRSAQKNKYYCQAI